ncbi:repressor LexA [Boudabousia tangfeifanii]|uniref:LexA repressor n=1 Tax=Boudabousia tangfeifanii TaxID=1912795 RepID=A0A1D9MKZ8_9ACTO|nr:transcriptional repressor LexA [Boudabousia tangfeifanii]AOZ72859.1 repressor LexA [Boudabousia tangfeifanii]
MSPDIASFDGSDLKDRPRQILAYLSSAVESQGYMPSVREICDAVGLNSPSSVQHNLKILADAGYIKRHGNTSRAIEVLHPYPPRSAGNNNPDFSDHSETIANIQDEATTTSPTTNDNSSAQINPPGLDYVDYFSHDATPVPLVGRIAAGVPITAEQAVEDTFMLPTRLTGSGELFMLSVSGDSMIDAAICDGDWVVVRRQNVAERGEIVAAMIDGEATVKVWSQRDGHSWLLPRNSEYAPIPADHATILGKVVSVLRSL